MVSDSICTLAYLVRTGIWSAPSSLMKFKRVVIDVDSIVTFLYKLCISNHIRRQRSIISTNQLPDLYSATIVNYIEFSRLVKQFFDYFVEHNIKPVLVYEGKFMEAPLFGLTAAKFKKNTQRITELLSALSEYDKGRNNSKANLDSIAQLGRSNLALNIFKSIVNIRRRAGADIQAYQAFYSSYSMLAKLARDFYCPVLTNNGDFIAMDVRAGFVLFEEFWHQHIELNDLVSRDHQRPRSNSSVESKGSPRGVIKSAARSTRSAGGAVYAISRFHYNSLFLRQHPGLNARLAVNLFPLLMVDFVTKYSESLKRLKVYDIVFQEKDFAQSFGTDKQFYKSHHLAAKRLEMALTFLSGKTDDLLGNFIRGEAARANTSFDEDYRHLFNYYTIAYEFKGRLRFILKHVSDPIQLNYIEWCLVNRECTADYLLVLLCCSIGHLATVSHNRWIQYEDLDSKRSAYSMLNRGKSMVMSLFSLNKSHPSEQSISRQQQETVTRYSTATLTVVDRQKSKLIEHSIATTHGDSLMDSIRDKLQLTKLARRQVAKQDCVKFINLVFKSSNLTQLPPKIDSLVNKYLGKDEQHIRNELAIVRSLYKSSLLEASLGDSQFKLTYSKIDYHLEVAILNHYLYMNQVLSAQKHKDLLTLVNIVNRLDFENVANQSSVGDSTHHQSQQQQQTQRSPKGGQGKKLTKSSSKTKSPQAKSSESIAATTKHNHQVIKQIRHLIELLNASIEAYCELNAFFDYPLARLNLHLHYNPVLLYNLTLYSYDNVNNKALLRF